MYPSLENFHLLSNFGISLNRYRIEGNWIRLLNLRANIFEILSVLSAHETLKTSFESLSNRAKQSAVTVPQRRSFQGIEADLEYSGIDLFSRCNRVYGRR